MFGIYDTVGMVFKGSMEDLYRIKALSKGVRIENNLQEQTQFQEMLRNNIAKNQAEITKNAKDSYGKIQQLQEQTSIIHIKDIMTKDVVSVTTDFSVMDVQEILYKNEIKQVPVLSRDGALVNLFSKEMILELLANDCIHAKEHLARKLDSFYSFGVVFVDPMSVITRAARVMSELHLHALPVVSQTNSLVGIVTRGDLLKVLTLEDKIVSFG